MSPAPSAQTSASQHPNSRFALLQNSFPTHGNALKTQVTFFLFTLFLFKTNIPWTKQSYKFKRFIK